MHGRAMAQRLRDAPAGRRRPWRRGLGEGIDASAGRAYRRRLRRRRRRRPIQPVDPHQLRRHRLLGGGAHDGRRRHGRGRLHPARKPDDLEGQGLGDGPGHQGRPGRVRDRHHQGPARSPAGAAVLRREGRGRAVGQRSQQAQDREVRPGCARARRQRLAADRDESSQNVEIAAGGENAGSTGGSRSPTRAQADHSHEGPDRRRVRRGRR